MPLVRRRLLESNSDTFDANGVATARKGPNAYGDVWTITRVVISTTSVLQTTAKMYLNSILADNLIDVSAMGNADISDTSDINLGTTEKLIVRWTGGTPGTIATMVLYGIAER